MDWIQIKIITSNTGIEPVCGKLYSMDITGVEISDKDDFAEFLENNRKYWDYVDETLEKLKTEDTCITLYVSDDGEGRKQVEKIKNSIAELKKIDTECEYGSLEILTANKKDEDWSENWKQYFHPLKVGKKILIIPEWERTSDTDGRIPFIIEPGMSFGTGSHESTQMCIEEIENRLKKGDNVLDLGCGSGILSIISLLLGATDATAVDIDPMAVEVAYSNLQLNNLSKDIYHGYAGDIITDKKLKSEIETKKYDIVIANIVADVIINLSSFVKEFMKDDGVFICSGIISTRKNEVVEALKKAGLTVELVKEKGEWAAAVCTK